MSDGDAPGDVNSRWPRRDGSAFDASARPVRDMDEKSLKDLQGRLRRAREKNFSLLRRQGAARVASEGARGSAQPANEKRGEKLEIFDEALARVGERLGAIE